MAIKIGNKEIVDGDDHATFDNIITGIQGISGYAIRVGNRGLPGSLRGYVSGGVISPPAYTSIIDKFPFASDTSASNVAALTQSRAYPAGQSSDTHGYASGGQNAPTTYLNVIDKFLFASDADAQTVGNLTQERSHASGQSSSIHGYTSGGRHYAAITSPPTPPNVETIDKFQFASDANADGVGNLSLSRNYQAGQSSDTHGYTSSGNIIPYFTNTYYDIIEKFPFATDADATDIANLTQSRGSSAGQSSYTYGYTSGGQIGPGSANSTSRIDKFPFSTDADATLVGDLTVGRYASSGQSSTEYGYTSGGWRSTPYAPGIRENTIDKFSFVTDADATDVGNLSQTRSSTTGQQV